MLDPEDGGFPELAGLLLEVTDGPIPDCPQQICPHGSVTIVDVMWVTPDALLEATDLQPPQPAAALYPAFPQPGEPRPLAEEARLDAVPGDLVDAQLDDDGYAVVAVTPTE